MRTRSYGTWKDGFKHLRFSTHVQLTAGLDSKEARKVREQNRPEALNHEVQIPIRWNDADHWSYTEVAVGYFERSSQ